MEWFTHRPGGLNRYFRDLYLALQASSTCQPSAVVLGPAPEHPSGVATAASERDPLHQRLRAYRRTALDLATSTGADVVDAHFALYSVLPLTTSRLRKLPLVLHFHGPWADESRASGERSAVRIGLKRTLERLVYSRADRIVVLSQAFKRLLVEQYRVQPWDIQPILPGVDHERFTPGSKTAARAKLGLPKDAWIALSVRRLVPRMGLEHLVDAWSRLRFGGRDALLLVAGEGPLRTDLERQTEMLEVKHVVRFLGRVADSDLATLYQAADVCVVPSTALEGLGLVVLESLACGTPVVATEVGGLGEALAGLDPNLLVPPAEPAQLARRLQSAFDGTAPLPDSSTCTEFVADFDWGRVAREHEALYAELKRGAHRQKLRVVYLNHCAKLSGGELALLRLLRSLDEVDAHVILGEEGPLVSRLHNSGISVEVLPMPIRARTVRRHEVATRALPVGAVFSSLMYAARVARRLRQLRPDLVHTNSLKAGIYGSLAARLARIPVIWHLRDRIAPDYLPPGAVRVVRWLIRILPDAVIANSTSTLATVERPIRHARSFPDVVRVLYSPVQERIPHAFEETPDLRVGIVGRLTPWKGQDVFLKAFAKAFAGRNDIAVIIGARLFDETDEYERRLQSLAEELGISDRVEFVGFVENVESELAQLDVLVHASVIPEPFGQVVIEGMAAKIAVIAADAGGPSEIIEHGVTGLLYKSGDVNALADALRSLGADPERRRELAEAGHRRSHDFSPSVVGPRYLEFYKYVLMACTVWPAIF